MADKKTTGSPKQTDTQKKPAKPGGGGSQPVQVNPGFQGGGSGKGGGGKK